MGFPHETLRETKTPDMAKPNTPQTPGTPGVADYFNGRPVKTRSILIALAADILILARCEGAPATARYFTSKLNLPVSEKMIKIIKAKAAKGEIIVTREDLEKAAMAHPISAARMHREPSLCDPQCYRSVFPGKPRKKSAGPDVPEKPSIEIQGLRKSKPAKTTEPKPKEKTGETQKPAAPGKPSSTHRLVAEFCDSEFYPQSRGFLIQHAAQVVYIARMCRSTRRTAAFLSQKFGREFSRRPVEDILAKVESGEIVVTTEELEAAANQHPYALQFAKTCPEALNPTGKEGEPATNLTPGKIGPAIHRIVQILAPHHCLQNDELEASFLKTIPAAQRSAWKPENHKGCTPVASAIAFAKVNLRKGGYALPASAKGKDDGIHLTPKGMAMATNLKPYHDRFLRGISRGEL